MEKEKILLNATLCYLIRGNEVLLALKTKKIGQGCYNGYGGGIELREKPRKAAVRELREECRVKAKPKDLFKVAVIDFHNATAEGKTFVCRVHVFFLYKWEGEPLETDEMATPTWFGFNNLPDNLMLADKTWLPLVLEGKRIRARAYYGPYQKMLIGKVEVKEVKYLKKLHLMYLSG
jgi:8-oxo-dGTP diphosphatase